MADVADIPWLMELSTPYCVFVTHHKTRLDIIHATSVPKPQTRHQSNRNNMDKNKPEIPFDTFGCHKIFYIRLKMFIYYFKAIQVSPRRPDMSRKKVFKASYEM